MNATTKLLPCPFCGDEPEWDSDGESWVSISCRNQKCGIMPATEDLSTMEDAAELWNARYYGSNDTLAEFRKRAGAEQFESLRRIAYWRRHQADDLNRIGVVMANIRWHAFNSVLAWIDELTPTESLNKTPPPATIRHEHADTPEPS